MERCRVGGREGGRDRQRGLGEREDANKQKYSSVHVRTTGDCSPLLCACAPWRGLCFLLPSSGLCAAVGGAAAAPSRSLIAGPQSVAPPSRGGGIWGGAVNLSPVVGTLHAGVHGIPLAGELHIPPPSR